jgi:hypothetical protein
MVHGENLVVEFEGRDGGAGARGQEVYSRLLKNPFFLSS